MILGVGIIPRSIFLIDYFLSTVGMVSTRTMVRIYSSRIRKISNNNKVLAKRNKTKLLLLGAGSTGDKIVREI